MTRHRTVIAALAGWIGACLSLTSLGGCSDHAGSDVATAGAGATWRWRATSMEVSGLTTPIPPAGSSGPTLDLRVEFFDSERDETKALGVLVVKVLLDGQEIAGGRYDLGSPDVHRRAWDGVTETYAFPLTLSAEPAPGRTLVVQAAFDGVDRSRMTSSREVRWPERPR